MKRLSVDHRAYLRFHQILWQKRPDIPYGPKSLYCCLLTFENLISNQCHPCQETLSRLLCCAIRSIKPWTKLLEEKDLVRTQRLLMHGRRFIKYELFSPQPLSRSELSYFKRHGKLADFPSPASPKLIHSTTLQVGNMGSG